MNNAKFPGLSLYKRSRYYLDPAQHNGDVKIITPADPKKLKAVQEAKARKTRKDSVFPLNGHLSKTQIKRIKGSIVI